MMAICVSIPRVICVILLLINWSVMPVHSTENKCPLNMTLFHLPDGSMDCDICQICPYGHVEIKPCGYRIPPECRPCKKGTYYNPSTNVCIGCTVCLPGQFVQQACALEKDAVCDNCPAGTFSNVNNMLQCSNCSNCSNNVSAIHNCTSTADTVCQYDNEESLPIGIVIGIAVVAIIVVAIIFIVIYCCCCSRRNENNRSLAEQPLMEVQQVKDNVKFAAPLKKLEHSVGLLQHKCWFSVAFRVGPDYVMTTHSALNGMKKDSKLTITFDKDFSGNSKLYDLEPKPEYSDPELNVAILKIKNPQNDELPAPLPLLQDLSVVYSEIGFVDYYTADGRKSHFPCFVVGKDSDEFKTTKEEIEQNIGRNISHEFNDSKIFWKSFRNHGWPGSPGVVCVEDNNFKVACVFTDAVPSRQGEELLTASKELKKEVMFKGPSMEQVIQKLKKKKKTLAADLNMAIC